MSFNLGIRIPYSIRNFLNFRSFSSLPVTLNRPFSTTSSNSKYTSTDIQQARDWLSNLSKSSLPPESQFSISYARSSGPGGQNVNKVSTKATLKLDPKHWNINAEWMPLIVRHSIFSSSPIFPTSNQPDLASLNSNKLADNSGGGSSERSYYKFPYTTATGHLLIQSDRTRSRTNNLEDCYIKLVSAIQKSVYIPKELSQEIQDKWQGIKKATNERRLKTKKFHKDKKDSRRKSFDD